MEVASATRRLALCLIDFRLSSDVEVRQLQQEVGNDVIQINGCILPIQIMGDAIVSGAFRPCN